MSHTAETPRAFGVSDHDKYWQKRYHTGHANEGRLHRFLAETINRLAGPGGTVLDCGVGLGHVFRLCQDKQEMYGIDLSQYAIESSHLPPDRLRQADLNDGIPDFGRRFDVIVASMLLHWLSDPAKFIIDAIDHLNPDGHLVIVIPNITYYRYRVGFIFGRFPPISLSHRNFQTPREFERMVQGLNVRLTERKSHKPSIRAKLWPTLFSQDLVYVISADKSS